jgi:EmrB/QacA subfamily drug resistance transporter
MSPRARLFIHGAVLVGLFLGALDALIVGAAMPTIMSDLGGLHLYSWVFSAYLLARAVSLPIFGKLSDIFSTKKLYLAAIAIFVVSSLLSGAASDMVQLILFRSLQGVGAGGTFALAYIVVSDLSPPEKRGKMMGLISSVWGIASILGPAMGGFIVTFFSWRWIFYVNVPLGCIAMLGIFLFLGETRMRKGSDSVDILGALTLTTGVLAFLTTFLLAGREYPWTSPQILGLLTLSIISGVGFYHAEKSAADPVLSVKFFLNSRFSLSNGAAFFSSFAIFSLSSFGPMFIQGALRKTPAQLGIAMVPLSLAWSAGAFLCGQFIKSGTERLFGLVGAWLLVVGSLWTLGFSSSTNLALCSAVFALAGLGMGFVSVSTLLIVQNSLPPSDLGVATSSQQFARTLGGTLGIGVCGSLATAMLIEKLSAMEPLAALELATGPSSDKFIRNVESLFQPEVLALLPLNVREAFQGAVLDGMIPVFAAVSAASLVSLLFCYFIPRDPG